ncbi:MAG: hypothetical protein HY543_12025 [Deltaproteobacteria bacterium]|nr:hypothetical protein [Deltaproteobacteria bacterium]
MSHEISVATIAVDGIIDAVALLFTQTRMGEPIPLVQRTVQDIRRRLAQLFHGYVATAGVEGLHDLEHYFRGRLHEARHGASEGVAAETLEQLEYCFNEVMVCFELARQVCSQQEAVEIRQYLLADLPLLRPFDYGGKTVSL